MKQFAAHRAMPGKAATADPDLNVCPECYGRGWKVVADGGAGTAVRCDCLKRDLGQEHLDRAGIPERYRLCRFDNFETSTDDCEISEQLLRARTISERYVDRFFDPARNCFRESGLIYIGPPGVGKTHLAAALLTELTLRYQVRGRFVDFTALIHQIQSSFDPSSPESKQKILDPVVQAEVLVLDELGAQKPTEWVRDTLYLIMNSRYTRRLATIFTTNYRLERSNPRPLESPADRRLDSDAHAARGGPGPPHLSPSGAMAPSGGTPRPGRPSMRPPANPFSALAERISPQLLSRLYEMAEPVTLPDRDYRRVVKMHANRIGS